jgi:hypothetical protein
MKERTQLSLKLILSHIILLPLLILISLFTNHDSFLLVSISQTVLIILILSGYWEFLGLRFKKIYFLSSEAILITALILKALVLNKPETNLYLVVILLFIQIWLLFVLLKIIITIFRREKEAVEIVFPFKKGKYLITDGGNSRLSRLMNYHYFSPVHKKKKTNLSMLFATDIVRIKNSGNNFLPPDNNDYPIFGEKVFSPISGLVVKVESSISDNVPYSGDYPYNTGNTIVIHNGNNYLLLGHLKMDSIRVRPGDSINAGDLIAEAGNSGYSERPHIHMQLIYSNTENYWTGRGVSIEYEGKNLYKNRLINSESE